MTRVVDASVAVKWFAPEPLHEAARALLDEPEELAAPDWLLVEVANVLWKQQRRGFIEPAQTAQILKVLPGLLEVLPAASFVTRALEIARQLDHPVYDAVYLAVAEGSGATFITADTELWRRAQAHGFQVVLLGNPLPPA